jgi:hypothetical protein
MFDRESVSVGLPAGEAESAIGWDDDGFDDWVFQLTVDDLNTGWVDDDRQVLPPGFEDLLVGPFVAAVVSSVDVPKVNGHDAVRLLKARARLAAHHEAGRLEATSEIAFAPSSDAESGVLRSSDQVEHAAVEVDAVLTLTRRSSERDLELAVSLTGRLRRVWDAFSAGKLDLPRVRVFDSLLGHLPGETVETVLDGILEEAGGLTTGQLRARLAKLVMAVDPDGAASSFEEGL